MQKSRRGLALSILLPLAVGAVSSFLTRNSMALYQEVQKPPLSPPSIVFPIAWTILYLLMGTASYLAMTGSNALQKKAAANRWYLLQLAMNFFWSIFFFNFKLYLFSFLWLIAMYIAIFICTLYFFQIDRLAGQLMIPYHLWMFFAAYLNLSIVKMN